jgi:hypothetical protein
MVESTGEERIFKPCSTHEAGVYKMFMRKPAEKRSFFGSRNKYVDKRGINFDRE